MYNHIFHSLSVFSNNEEEVEREKAKEGGQDYKDHVKNAEGKEATDVS